MPYLDGQRPDRSTHFWRLLPARVTAAGLMRRRSNFAKEVAELERQPREDPEGREPQELVLFGDVIAAS